MTNLHAETARNLRQRAEEKARRGEEEVIETLTLENAKSMLHELRVHQIELELQQEELLLTQQELDSSLGRYFSLYHLAPVGYLTLSDAGLILEANLSVAVMLGVELKCLLKKPISQFIFREDQDTYYLNRKKVLEVNELQVWEMRLIQANGSPVWVNIHAAPSHDGECWITLSDISERRQAVEALKKSEIFTTPSCKRRSKVFG